MKIVLGVIGLGLLVGCEKSPIHEETREHGGKLSKSSEPTEFEKTKPLAEKGDPRAQYRLGWMFYNGVDQNGEEVKQDYNEALKWYRKAAEQGNALALDSLGAMYYLGRGVERDFKEALKWYRKATEKGHANAQWQLGVMYAKGEGVLKDNVAAYAWLDVAVANREEGAKSHRISLAKKMTPDQIAKAEALAKEMIRKNPKLLKKKE